MITDTRPHMLPKVRSEAIRKACENFPCSLRIASFIGLSCSGPNTVVGCHLPTDGKGIGTKVTDLSIAAGCQVCHDLLDGRDNRGRLIREKYPLGLADRIIRAQSETLTRLMMDGIIEINDAEIII